MESSNGRTARSCRAYDARWMMLDFRRSTGHSLPQWRSIMMTALRPNQSLARLSTRPGMDPERSHLRSTAVSLDAWLQCMFRKRNDRSWITESLPAYSLGIVFQLCRTSYTTHWLRRFTAPEMWYSEKESGTRHWTLQMKRYWMSTSTEISSRNPNPKGKAANRRWKFRTTNGAAIRPWFTSGSSKAKEEVTRIGWPWDVTWRWMEAAGRR